MAKTSKSAKPAKVVKKSLSESSLESLSSDSDSSSSSSSSLSSDSSDSSDSESETETKPAAKAAAATESLSESSSLSSSESDSDSDSDSSDSEAETKKEETPAKAASSSSGSDSESGSGSDSDSSSSSDSDSESEAEEAPKKRKAEAEEPSAKKQKTEEPAEAAAEPATLFVGRLSWNVDDDWLRREFEHIGGVVSARVMMERATGKSRGYGYVDFESKTYADKALAELQGHEIDGRPINLDLSTGKPKPSGQNDRAKKYGDVPSAPSDTLFVGNLSFNAERNKLFEVFGEYGTVVSCRVPTHPDTQQPKGFGYVQFLSVEEAQGAMNALNGEYIEGRACRLDFSTPRDPASNQGGRGGFQGGRGGSRGGRGGFSRDRSLTPTPRSTPRSEFKGTKKTFD